MKLIVCRVLCCVSVLLVWFNVIWTICLINNRVNEMKYIEKPYAVNITDDVFVLYDDTILFHNKHCGIVQIFDFEGKFIFGVHLSASKNIDSTLVSYDRTGVYLWEEKTKSVYKYAHGKLSNSNINEEVTNKDEFYEYYPLVKQKYKCNFNMRGKLVVTDTETYEKIQVNLKTTVYHYSFFQAFIGIFIGIGIFCFSRKQLHED